MNILQIIESTGNCYRKKASTGGGEFAGPCPWCGGDDRFGIYPARNHFVCRRCKKAGDSIAFVMDYFSKDYLSACEYLGIDLAIKFKALDLSKPNKHEDQIRWTPRKIEFPPEAWQEKATAILFQKFKFLMSASGKPYRDWLNDRGISNETIKIARMGYNTQSLSFDRETWGLPPENKENGKKRQIWLPVGLIIPQFYNQKLIQLRIRQENPISKDRFIIVPGSSMGYFDYSSHCNQASTPIKNNNRPWIVTEAGLDGWFIQQEAGDLCRVFAIGNSSARPDIETDKVISSGPGLLNLDNDEAGQLEQAWWKKNYPDSLTWYSSKEKDPGEDFQAGVNIREWVKDGLSKLKQQNILSGQSKNILSGHRAPTVSLKEKALENYKKKQIEQQKISAKKISLKKQTLIKSNKKYTKKCVHGLYCVSLKNNICLISKQSPFDTLTCPAEQWTAHERPGGIITEIILAPGVKK